jgi:hypothetical protein|tara:strand:- start:466 stop:732 length:267 start_codon:yes stop_codon:yes gene_type:complete
MSHKSSLTEEIKDVSQPFLAEVINLFYKNPRSYISTLELTVRGIPRPSQVIASLKAGGMKIDETLVSGTDEFGTVHSQVTCYKFEGGS